MPATVSAVRRRAGIAFVGETCEAVRMMIADLPVDGLDRETWHSGATPLASWAVPLPSTNDFQYRAAVAPGSDTALTVANLQRVLHTRAGRIDVELRKPSWTSLCRASFRLVDRYRAGPVLLAGDAAHIHSAAGGQGMTTGIQDAYNLG